MPPASFFAKLGLYLVPDFLEPELCARIRSEMRSAPYEPAIISRGSTYLVDEDARRTKWVRVSAETHALVKDRLMTVLPQVANHFNVLLSKSEPLQFLRYGEGDFFEAHTDNNDRHDAFDFVKARRVSVVIFLNSEVDQSQQDVYTGGELTLYGLIDKPGWKTKGFSLIGEPGLLIAFRSDVPHEVTPLTQGERYTIVTWFS